MSQSFGAVRSSSEGSAGRSALLVLAFLLLLPLTPLAVAAQETAAVSGEVENAVGAAVAGVTVELRNTSTGEVRTALAGEEGSYRFSAVAPGSYEIRVLREGYRATTTPLAVGDAESYEVDVALDQVFSLDRLVVTGTRAEREIGDIPVAVGVVGQEQIRQGKGINVEETLKRIPGVRVEDELGTAHRTRIIVRGTGTRANNPAGSGVRGVKVLVDGIPKNNAGGSAQDLTNVDLGSIGRIEAVKGPSSALYGNQSGGVVHLRTEAPAADPTRDYRLTVGSFGLQRHHLKFAGRNDDGKLGYVLSGFRTQQDGFRDHSGFHSTGFHGKLDYTIDERSSLSTILAYDRSFERSPGPLTLEQFEEDPRQAAGVFLEGGTRATIEELRFGMTYQREILGDDELEVTGFYTPRRLAPFVQIGVRIPQDFTNRGANARYLNEGSIAGRESRLTVGADFHNTPITTGVFGTDEGVAFAELEENATTYGVYALEELNLLEELLLSVGGRYDHIEFSSRDIAQAGAPEASRTYERMTPKLGLTYQPDPSLSLYTSYSRGFEAPIIGELRIVPGGEFGFNQDLDPQRTTSYEVGARGEPLPWLYFTSAVFRQNVHGLITPVGEFPRNSYDNVGRVRQLGVELSADVEVRRGLDLYLAYTFSDFVIREFEVDGDDFSDNQLPGVPRHDIMGEVEYRHPSGAVGSLEGHHVGSFYFDNANSASNDPYTVMNIRASYEGAIAGLALSPFLGINNLGDEEYSAFALINDEQRRFYNPLPGRHAFGGVRVTF